jgi:bifunctional non-homologous end joining protein LigD
MVPIEPDLTHDEARDYCKAAAERLSRTDPVRYTLAAASELRAGRIYIDYLRNGRGSTAVGAYSPRARSGFPVAAPVTWSEVEARTAPDAYTMDRPPRRGRL